MIARFFFDSRHFEPSAIKRAVIDRAYNQSRTLIHRYTPPVLSLEVVTKILDELE
jgi:hypothetical protein